MFLPALAMAQARRRASSGCPGPTCRQLAHGTPRLLKPVALSGDLSFSGVPNADSSPASMMREQKSVAKALGSLPRRHLKKLIRCQSDRLSECQVTMSNKSILSSWKGEVFAIRSQQPAKVPNSFLDVVNVKTVLAQQIVIGATMI